MAGDWVWITADVASVLHDHHIVEHGRGSGVRDPGLLESALAGPQNLSAYDAPDAAQLAAAYACGIARNHPCVDGNKRTAAVVSELFLRRNGYRLEATNPDVVVALLALDAGELSEDELADWFRQRVVQND